MLLVSFEIDCISVVAATACTRLVPFLLTPAAAPGRHSPGRMKLQCLSLVAAFLLGVSSVVCTHQLPSTSALASLRLHAWFPARSLLLLLTSGSILASGQLPAPTPVVHMSAPVRRGAVLVTNARLGLAQCSVCFSSLLFIAMATSALL